MFLGWRHFLMTCDLPVESIPKAQEKPPPKWLLSLPLKAWARFSFQFAKFSHLPWHEEQGRSRPKADVYESETELKFLPLGSCPVVLLLRYLGCSDSFPFPSRPISFPPLLSPLPSYFPSPQVNMRISNILRTLACLLLSENMR